MFNLCFSNTASDLANTLDRTHNIVVHKHIHVAYTTVRCRTRALAGDIRDHLIRCRVFKGPGSAPHFAPRVAPSSPHLRTISRRSRPST
jgi:hypothetical protein